MIFFGIFFCQKSTFGGLTLNKKIMKRVKNCIAAAMIISAVSISNAQNEADNTDSKAISFGVKGGVNFATVTGEIGRAHV